jgi:hypothetical protein
MEASGRLLDFFLREIEFEERSGFSRLGRVPDSHVAARLAYYRSLSDQDRQAFRDCSAHCAHACYSFVVNAPQIDHTRHPFFKMWSTRLPRKRSVPDLRVAVQQYKMDAYRGVRSCVSEEEFRFASSIRAVKAPDLRKRVRASLRPLGYYRLDELGYYHCRHDSREFRIHVDYGGSHAQLRYCVSMPEFSDVHPLGQFCFERVLGFGQGDWDYIVEENLDEALSLFAEVVLYCVALPDRIRAQAA